MRCCPNRTARARSPQVLLDEDGNSIRLMFLSAFELILRFCKVQEQLFVAASAHAAMVLQKRRRDKGAERRGKWADDNDEDNRASRSAMSSRARATAAQLREIHEKYVNQVLQLLVTLRREKKYSADGGNLHFLAWTTRTHPPARPPACLTIQLPTRLTLWWWCVCVCARARGGGGRGASNSRRCIVASRA